MQSDNATEPWAHVVVAVVQPRQHPPGQPLRRRAVSERASALFVGLPLQAVGALAQTAQEYNPFALGRLYRKRTANARQPCFFPPIVWHRLCEIVTRNASLAHLPDALDPGLGLGFGRIVASEIEAPNLLVDLV